MWSDILELVCVTYVAFLTIGTLVDTLWSISDLESCVFNKTPNDFYNETTMNKFGCWFCCIALQMFSALTILRIIVSIIVGVYKFIYMIFHTGRKD